MNKTFLFFLFCSTEILSAQKSEIPIKILDATSQEWVAGQPGGKSGTNYSIKVYIRTGKSISFTNVWLGKQNVPFDKEFFTQDRNTIKEGDSLLLTYNQMYGAENKNVVSKLLPIPYKGAALIECTVNSKLRYFIVKKFRKIQALKGK